ncbi:MAG: cobalamin biosynthesis protein CobW [Cyanobacteria bacterium RI_101]|nr:cobalamin biosynthesis protein CobW [Cyanobacteria bacterium RI_101]
MSKVPVTVITGFLGAGKTTLLRYLLQNNPGRRLAALVNEFGEVGIDGELLRGCCEGEAPPILELTNGCLCCAVQEEFFPAMRELLDLEAPPEGIIIETSGLALPKPLAQAFRWPEIRSRATVSGVAAVADAWALSQGRLATDLAALLSQRRADEALDHETPLEELFIDQLACADLVLLTKADLVTPEQLGVLKDQLAPHLRPGVKILPTQGGQVSLDLLLGLGLEVEEHLDSRPSHHDEEDHDHDDEIQSWSFAAPETLNLEELLTALKDIQQEQDLYRVKGFVNLPHKPLRLTLQGVGARWETFYDRPWRREEIRGTRLVFIGRNLDVQAVERRLGQGAS